MRGLCGSAPNNKNAINLHWRSRFMNSLRSVLKAGACGWLAVALTAGAVQAASAPPALSPASSAEFQKLLSVQVGKRAVHFNEHKMPTTPETTYQRLFAWNEVA